MLAQQAQATRRQAMPAPEPVVNISIQYVEVIASPPANPSRPTEESRPKGVMSLDEYLNKRQQEGKHEQ